MRLALIAALGLAVAGRALACGCSSQTAENHPHVDKYADAIFVGEVTGVSGPVSDQLVLVTFKVIDLRRGPKAEFIVIEVHNGGSSCDLNRTSFQVGERFLISGTTTERHEAADKLIARSASQYPRFFNNYCGVRERVDVTPNNSLERTDDK
jgi:hypothetical protein